jgi:hypothetical protein
MDPDHPLYASLQPDLPPPPSNAQIMHIVNHLDTQEHTTIIAADATRTGRISREIDIAIARNALPPPTTRPPLGTSYGVYAWHLWPGPTLKDIDYVAERDPGGAAILRERAGPNRALVARNKRIILGELRAIEARCK